MNRNKLLKLSLICFICAIIIFAIAYFFFHFVTDSGITLLWHPEAGKPFVTDLIGMLGVLMVWSSIMSLISAFLFFPKGKR